MHNVIIDDNICLIHITELFSNGEMVECHPWITEFTRSHRSYKTRYASYDHLVDLAGIEISCAFLYMDLYP